MTRFLTLTTAWLVMMAAVWPATAATPTAEQALQLTPIQPGIDYDSPTAADVPKCKISAKKFDGHVGWIVEGPDGTILRKFIDTNDNNVVDQWSYYKDGLEVYRDIDTNHNGKADQYRWFHTGGSRWAIDKNEDGVVDSWKSISAEEVTSEIVGAIASHDSERFAHLLITSEELKSLGLGKSRETTVAEKASKAAAEFKTMSARQKTVLKDTSWVQFSANRPGVVPAGTDDSTKDVRVYENVTAIVDNAGKSSQVQVGTLVQVGDTWRAIELPQVAGDGQAETDFSNVFFRTADVRSTDAGTENAADSSQKLLADLETLDRESAKATTPEEQAKLTSKRAELLEQIAGAAKNPDDRAMWIRQLADMLSAAVQAGVYPEGAERLKTLFEKLNKNEADKALAAYARFRELTAEYVLSMQAPKADYSKIQTEWLKTLEQYVTDYPTAVDAAEAMLQLAISQEFMGQEDDAKKWYSRIVKEFPDSNAAKKATGAQTRLDCVGKPIVLVGQSPTKVPVDLAKFKGKVVLIQYWATWSSPSKSDMAALKELTAKYGRNFTVIGVNLDNSVNDLTAYLAENPLPWPQIYEEGGLDSRPANTLGILTVPTMILVDQQGKVVNRNITASELEAELKRLVK